MSIILSVIILFCPRNFLKTQYSVADFGWCAAQAKPRTKCGQGPATTTLCGGLLEIRSLDKHPRPAESEYTTKIPRGLHFNKIPWTFLCTWQFEKHGYAVYILPHGKSLKIIVIRDVNCFCLQLPVCQCAPFHPQMD